MTFCVRFSLIFIQASFAQGDSRCLRMLSQSLNLIVFQEGFIWHFTGSPCTQTLELCRQTEQSHVGAVVLRIFHGINYDCNTVIKHAKCLWVCALIDHTSHQTILTYSICTAELFTCLNYIAITHKFFSLGFILRIVALQQLFSILAAEFFRSTSATSLVLVEPVLFRIFGPFCYDSTHFDQDHCDHWGPLHHEHCAVSVTMPAFWVPPGIFLPFVSALLCCAVTAPENRLRTGGLCQQYMRL